MANRPSVKTLSAIAGDRAKELRAVLEIIHRCDLETLLERTDNEVLRYPVTRTWYRSRHHPMDFTRAKMSIASEIIGGCGVEGIDAGKGVRSPRVEYVNMGDAYTRTLLYVYGKGYRVGCWGGIVERGDYA